jgi:hypothetical protein
MQEATVGAPPFSAIASALMVTWRSLTALRAHPTTNREKRSRTTAKYTFWLVPMTNSVVSPTHR